MQAAHARAILDFQIMDVLQLHLVSVSQLVGDLGGQLVVTCTRRRGLAIDPLTATCLLAVAHTYISLFSQVG